MTVQDITADIDQLYADREAHAREWHRNGGRVIGVLGGTAPVELITAAGMFPLRLIGNPAGGTALADVYLEPVREGFIRAILEKLLAGDYNYLDLIVIPRSAEGLLQIYYVLEHIRNTEPERKLPPVHLFDVLQTPFDYTRRYVTDRMNELKSKLEAISGKTISDADISVAIERHDEGRRLFGRLSSVRRSAAPASLSGSTMLKLAAAGQVIPADQFSALLGRAMDLPVDEVKGPRLMIKGSPHEHHQFYQMVEAAGATVVADDHDWGEPLYRTQVGVSGDGPIAALVEHCMFHRPGPRRLPQERVDGEFLDLVRERAVDGVIVALEEHDDTLGWDYPAQKRALDELGVPSILLTGQRYASVDDATKEAVARFIRELNA